MKYHCNCCGCDFSEDEAFEVALFEDSIICPECGAERYDDDDDIIEAYQS